MAAVWSLYIFMQAGFMLPPLAWIFYLWRMRSPYFSQEQRPFWIDMYLVIGLEGGYSIFAVISAILLLNNNVLAFVLQPVATLIWFFSCMIMADHLGARHWRRLFLDRH